MTREQNTSASSLLSRAATAAADEYGSVLCAWFDMNTQRGCAINSPAIRACRCREVARAIIPVVLRAAADVVNRVGSPGSDSLATMILDLEHSDDK
jgi:hypothetical protein